MDSISILYLSDNHLNVVGSFRRLFFFALLSLAFVCASAAPQSTDSASHVGPDAPAQAAQAKPSAPAQAQPAKPSTSTKKPRKAKSRKPARLRAKSRRNSPRFRRTHQAFVVSGTLKPMALQLLQNRTPAAYAGVEAYARKHNGEDAGSLAWLAVGYAYFLDHQYPKSIDSLSRAKPHGGEIGDYITYYLASSQLQSGHTAEAMALLSKFDDSFPESLLIRDVHVLYAGALVTANRAKEAVALLEKDRAPIRADLELALGRAYAAAGDPAKAVAVLRHIYFDLPLSFEATVVQSDLQKLSSTPGISPPSFGAVKSRADALARAKRFSDAADAYRDLLREATPTDKPDIQLALAESLHHSGQDREVKPLLNSVDSTSPEIAARKLYDIGELQRAANDDDGFLRTVDQIRQAAPTSPWLEQALLYVGNIYLLRKDYDKAIDAYREIETRFPGGARSPYSHWKVAWLSLRKGRDAEAKTEFEQQIEMYPDSSEVPAALYWRGRLAEEEGDAAMASAYYQKVSDRFRNYYYGPLARERQSKLNVGSDPPHFAVLDHVPPINGIQAITDDAPPEDDLRVEKAHLLENGGLLDFAIRELKAAAEEDKGDWLPAETARMYQDAGRYDAAVETLKRAVPNYFAVDLSTLPRSYWEALFPKPFWPDLKRFADANGLDPYMVASLVRQESEFNPGAVSNKNAMGLMQLLPKVGKGVAKQVKLKHFSQQQLFTPVINLQLGTRYFRSMVDKFGGFEYALAAYNAGDDRVKDWQSIGKYRDVQEFVESIPFTETREYVQAIMRNANVYRQLYGTP
ncbi:MAG: Lytic transglycosylase, catalytic [Acidobacteriaceae bacterium]|nr:Lytic transglycosylase, catalytic [Acidobacteriaceae bacterium]